MSINSGDYQQSSLNAVTHGILSRHVVLPHENRSEYEQLLQALQTEYQPNGPTESHLVEDLAGIMWRKQRVLQAEGSRINRGISHSLMYSDDLGINSLPLKKSLSIDTTEIKSLATLSEEELAKRWDYAQQDLAATLKALDVLKSSTNTAYPNAVKVLLEESREWWLELTEDDEYTADADGLKKFLHEQLIPVCQSQCRAIEYLPAMKTQLLGNGIQSQRLDQLSRYETHLDRKFEKTLGMLLKLQDLKPRAS